MFEFIGFLFATAIFFGFAFLLGLGFGLGGWILFVGRRRPWRLIAIAALTPPVAAAYMFGCAIVFEIAVPNQPDVLFGDISEPLPNGYVLKGLGKMPEFAYFDGGPSSKFPAPILGGVRRLELDGQMVYGAYGHLNDDSAPFDQNDHGYFAFDTRSGQVQNFDSLAKLNASAGHPVHFVETQFFRSQEPGRKFLILIEDLISFGPPIVACLICLYLLIRRRVRGETQAGTRPKWEPPEWETLTN
jgi:hypothetical protein